MGEWIKPNFLGIASVRGGSTWLYQILYSHSSFFLPTKRKEIQYFTRYHDKGDDWYFSWFKNSHGVPWRGEFTPGYLTSPIAPRAISDLNCIKKLLLILRDPVERTISHYKWHLRVTGENLSFKDFYTQIPKLAIENSMYFKYLSNYLEYFDRDQFLILIFEESINNPACMLSSLGEFFSVDISGFVIAKKANAGTMPRFRRAFNTFHRLNQYLRKYDFDFIPNAFKKAGVKALFGRKDVSENQHFCIQEEDRQILMGMFHEDVMKLEKFLGRKIESWKN